jgi:hypothetical protein
MGERLLVSLKGVSETTSSSALGTRRPACYAAPGTNRWIATATTCIAASAKQTEVRNAVAIT